METFSLRRSLSLPGVPGGGACVKASQNNARDSSFAIIERLVETARSQGVMLS